MYYFLKMVTKKSPVKWSYPLFLQSAKLEFHCNTSTYIGHMRLYCATGVCATVHLLSKKTVKQEARLWFFEADLYSLCHNRAHIVVGIPQSTS